MTERPHAATDAPKGFWEEVATFVRGARLKLFPLGKTLRHYSFKDFKSDCKAGLNVSLLDFPQSMAYAMIAGLPTVFGLMGSAISSLVGPLFAGSRFVMLGPTNASAVLLLSGLISVNIAPEQWPLVLPLLILMVAGILLLGAFLHVASFVQYISRTVLTGYISAAALLIIVNQIPAALGFSGTVARQSTVAQMALEAARHLCETEAAQCGIALATLALFFLGKRFTPKAPNVVVAIVGASALAALARYVFPETFAFDALAPVVVGDLTAKLPEFKLEWFSQLSSPAFAIAFLCILESSSIAKTLAARSGDRFNPNQQMYSLGMANFANAFLGGMPASGSLTRSTLNWASGARTGVSSLISGTLMLTGIFVLGRYLEYVPRAALAALVIYIGVTLLNLKNIRMMVRATKSDAIAFLLTFVAGLFFPLDVAIYLGAAASILLFLRKAANPELMEIGFNEEGELTEVAPADSPVPLREIPDIAIVHVEGDLFFGASDLFLEQARLLVADPNKRITVLRLRNARHLDATCAMAIADLINFARTQGRDIIVSGATPDIERVLRDSGVLAVLGEKNFFPLVAGNPNISTRYALQRAQEILGRDSANIVIYAKQKAPAATADPAHTPHA